MLRPRLQQRDAKGIEAQKEEQAPIGALPDHYSDPDRNQDKITARLCQRTEQGVTKGGVPGLQGMVHQLISWREVAASGRQRKAHKKEQIEERKPKERRHPVGGGGLPTRRR
jgi:hypothetical protein